MSDYDLLCQACNLYPPQQPAWLITLHPFTPSPSFARCKSSCIASVCTVRESDAMLRSRR